MSQEIRREVERIIGSTDFSNLTDEDYRKLLNEVFYERLLNKPSEKIDLDRGNVSLSKTEILATSPTYRGPSNFSLVDNDSSIIVSVTPTRLRGDSLEFVLPFQGKHDLENFIILLQYLDEISKIKYPEEEIEIS